MSRIEHRDHIRLLERQTVQERGAAYHYLTEIKPDKSIAPFLHGYTADGLPWDPVHALTYSKRKEKTSN